MKSKHHFAGLALAMLMLAGSPATAYDHSTWDINPEGGTCIASTTNGPDAIAIGELRNQSGTAMIGVYSNSLAPVVTLDPADISFTVNGQALPLADLQLGSAKPEIRPNVIGIMDRALLAPYFGKPFELQVHAKGKMVWRERIDFSGQALSDYSDCMAQK